MKKILLEIIKFYQKTKPFSYFFFSRCIFIPSCSQFTYEAIEKYGVIKGSFIGLKRILKCHPFSKGGYDPVR